MLKAVPSEEVYRKMLHLLVILLPLGVFYGPTILDLNREKLAIFAGVLLGVSIFFESLRFKNTAFGDWFYTSFGSMLRNEERSSVTGATYVAGATFLCAWISILSESFAASSCLALTLFILGDAVAALVGKLIGRIYVGKKTLEGAVACFLSCLLLGYFVFPLLPEFLKKMGGEISFLQAVIIAFSIAILEMFPIKIGRLRLNDNLYVPVLVTLIAYYIIKY